MNTTWTNRLSAIGLIGLVGLLAVSSCVIHIGTGDGDWGAGGTSVGEGGAIGTGNATGGSGGTAPTNIPAELAQLDPAEIARTNAIAGYAAVTTSNLVQAVVPDPATADSALLEQLVAEYGPKLRSNRWLGRIAPPFQRSI